MKARPQDDLITTLVGVDDSFGRCVAICVERKGVQEMCSVSRHWLLSRDHWVSHEW